MPGPFGQQLTQRRVPQVLALYLGATWGLLEASTWATDRFGVWPHLPDLLMAAAAMLLPVALVLAWRVGGERPDPGERGVAGMPRELAPDPPPGSVAVLSFDNLSSNPDDAFLADGIADQVNSALARLEGVQVASRTSARTYRQRQVDVRRIGRELGVRAVLEGSVQRAGDRLRVAANLVDVRDGYHLWSDRIEGEMPDIFRMEDEIAEGVAGALEVFLREEERHELEKAPTGNVRAYEYYLRGRQFFFQTRRKSLGYAREMYRKAVELDPGFALAHAGLADANSLLRMYYRVGAGDMAEAERAASKALELEPALGAAHSAMAAVLFLTERTAEAEVEFRTAVRLDPNLYEAHYFYARMCFEQGRLEQAAGLFTAASRLRDEYQATFFAAQSLEALDREDEAREQYARALDAVGSHMELNPDDARAATMRAVSLCRLGRREEGLRWAEQAVLMDPDDGAVRYNTACLFAVAGEHERALELLDSALAQGFGNPQWLEHDPDLDSLRGDPRFRALLERPAAGSSPVLEE